MSTEVRMLNVLRTVEPTATSTDPITGSKIDLFDTIATPPWSDAGTWTLELVLTSGIVVANNGRATTGDETGLYTAVYDDQDISTNAFREVTLGNPLFVDGIRYSILMDMDITTPVPAASLRMLVCQFGEAPTGIHRIDLFRDGIQVTGKSVPIRFFVEAMRMTIDATNTVRCYLSSITVPDITIGLTGYIPAGGRVGFGMDAANQFKPSVSNFHFTFTTKQDPAVAVVGSDLARRALISSANGVLSVERKDGNMAALNTQVRTLASNRLLSSVNRLTKLYIADYKLLKFGSTTGSNEGAAFKDSGVTDWTALGETEAVIKNDYRIEILSGTNPPSAIYDITAAVGDTLSLSPTPFRDGTSLKYRVVRAQKVFDSELMTLTLVPLGFVPTTADGAGNPIGGPPGQFPLGSTIVSLLGDRLIWTGDPLFPQVLYMSKASVIDKVTGFDGANDYLYNNETEGEAFAYDSNRFSGAGQIGDAVTAVIPHSLDQMIIAGYRSISIQRGDPTLGGPLDLITRDIGIIDKFAWCYTPDQNVLGMSPDGLYLFPSSADTAPLRVSRERLPRELIDIDTALFDVQMAYDIENQGANIFVTPKDEGAATTHWWFDWGKKAFWPESFRSGHEPTAVTVHTLAAQGSSLPVVIMGGRDGYLRVASNQSSTDDGDLIASTALLGPFLLGSPQLHGLLHRLWMELDPLSGAVNVDILVGDTAAKAHKSIPVHSFLLSQAGDTDGPITEIVRARGGACFIRLTNNTATAWALESAVLEREVVGERRNA